MKLEFGYGTGVQTVEVPERNLMTVLTANEIDHERRGAAAVDHALAHPIGAPDLKTLAKPGRKVVLLTSDITRPLPSHEVLPSVLRELNEAGVPDRDITVVFAIGSHRALTEEERRSLAGDEIFDRVRCVDSDPNDCILTGTSSHGTPFAITRTVAEADLRIALGNIEFHYFAGYSGGVKALMPGASTPAAIQVNHSRMVSTDARAGTLRGNPVREDLEEVLDACPIHFLVNVVLDEHHQIVYAAAGDAIEAHRAGCRYLDRMYRTPIPKRADIVLA
ncbi:MAG: nickel-dependent lactate racemase, partial [Clostridia bacterium]|nr:nickel-dependent lactate racemase [Clostridia bacterium]